MKRLLLSMWCVACLSTPAERVFFPMDNGLRDVEGYAAQAALLKELGYDGMSIRPNYATDKVLRAFDEQGLVIPATYVSLSPKMTQLPEHLIKHFKALKGRDTIVWLMLLGGDASEGVSDEEVVALIKKVCTAARENGLPVALYPHVGCRTGTIKECMRLIELTGDPDLGISFTLCHFLRQNEDEQIEPTIRAIAPRLKLVQINGADNVPRSETNWDYYIKPLGEGDLDVGRVIRVLDEVGYGGPVNLQCYRVKGSARAHLTTSIEAWRQYCE